VPQNERGPFAFREPGERRRHVAVDLVRERPAIGKRILGRKRFDRIALVVIRALQDDAMRAAAAEKVDPAAGAFRRALAIALPASLTVHLLAATWVQDLEFHVAYLGPMVLALGVARILLDVSWPGPRWRRSCRRNAGGRECTAAAI